MDNSSAYANVLLKSPALKAPAATPATNAVKRDYEKNDAPADFQQAFHDVNGSLKHQEDKTLKPGNSKKSSSVESHEAKHAQAKKVGEAANEVREQPLEHNNKELGANKSNDGEWVREATDPVSNIIADASQNKLMGMNLLGAFDAGEFDAGELTDVVLTNTTETQLGIADMAAISVAPLSVETASDMAADFDFVLPIEPPSIDLSAQGLTSLAVSLDASITADKSGVTASLQVANESLLGKTLSQPYAETAFALANNQPLNSQVSTSGEALAVGVLGVDALSAGALSAGALTVDALAVGATASPTAAKTLAPTDVQTEAIQGDDAIDLLAPLLKESSTPATLTSVSNNAPTSNTVNSDVTTTQVQMNASKTTFEKTLASLVSFNPTVSPNSTVSPDASMADDLVAQSSSSSSTNTLTNSLLDSLVRGADQPSPAARSFVVQTAVPVPVGQPQWSQAVGEKVLWLAAQNVSSAEINLHPKDLGPMQVRVSVNQEQTTVSFTSHHAVVRDVLDQNLNRLRDMFSEQGLHLVNVDVSDKSFSRQQGDAQHQKGQGGANDIVQDEETAVAISTIVQQRLVDHYA